MTEKNSAYRLRTPLLLPWLLLLSLLLLPLLLLSSASRAEEHRLTFTAQEIHAWPQKSFVDYTDYTLSARQPTQSKEEEKRSQTKDSSSKVLSAKAHGQASALYHETTIDLTKTPYLQWRWRVDKQPVITNARQKNQDDYPARIYLVIKEGIFPWQVRSLNYVWASHKPQEDFWPNPYTDRAIMIPLRDANDAQQKWVSEKINIVADYQRIFGRRISEIHGIAIMTDTDNTGGKAHAYYDTLTFTAD
ncbi:MAG: DUF3047 domain-containing protein [Cellvibrionaceae bacterium]